MSESEGVQEKSTLPGIKQALQAVKDRIRKGGNGSSEKIVPEAIASVVSVPAPDAQGVSETPVSVEGAPKPKKPRKVKAKPAKEAKPKVAKRKVPRKKLVAGDNVVAVAPLVDGASLPVRAAKHKAFIGKPRSLGAIGLTGFNVKEVEVLRQLKQHSEPLTIPVLAELCFRDMDEKRTSCVRNSLRRLVRDGAIEQVRRGTYRLTDGGKTLFS